MKSASQHTTISVKLPHADVASFRGAIKSKFPDTNTVALASSKGLTKRHQVGHVELIEIIIHVGLSITAEHVISYIKSSLFSNKTIDIEVSAKQEEISSENPDTQK